MPSKKETIQIKTANGKVTVVRDDKKATITKERSFQGFGYKEKSITEVTKLDGSCVHYAFAPEKQLIATFKSY